MYKVGSSGGKKKMSELMLSTSVPTENSTTSTTSSPVLEPGPSSDSAVAPAGTSSVSFNSTLTEGKNSEGSETPTTTVASNLDALADSFGGSTAAPDPVLPTRRKTGLYFLVDWNTFLEVGEEEKDKVNLRFQPKVGDRTRFISVTVP